MHLIIGQRSSGKTTAILNMIGTGVGTLVVVGSESARDVYCAVAPRATVMLIPDGMEGGCVDSHSFSTVVFDGAELQGVRADIVTYVHPHMARMALTCMSSTARGLITLMSPYRDGWATEALDVLRSRFEVQGVDQIRVAWGDGTDHAAMTRVG